MPPDAEKGNPYQHEQSDAAKALWRRAQKMARAQSHADDQNGES